MDQLLYYEKLFIIHLGGHQDLISRQYRDDEVDNFEEASTHTCTEYIKCDKWSSDTIHKGRKTLKSGKMIETGHHISTN